VKVVLTDRDRYHAGLAGGAILWALGRTSRDARVVRAATFDGRFGRPAMREVPLRGEDPEAVTSRDDDAVAAWRRQVAPFLLYR